MKLQKPKEQDILPTESVKWRYVEDFARKIYQAPITMRKFARLF